MKEEFLQYLWQLGLFDLGQLETTEGAALTLLQRGQLNHNAGPDFLNAKIKIGPLIWKGNVEIHIRSGEWMDHKHHLDEAYNNVILHVVLEKDKEVYTQAGNRIPTLELKDRIPAGILGRYKALSASLLEIPCQKQIPQLNRLRITHWLERLAITRLESKSKKILSIYEEMGKDWEKTLFHLFASYMVGKVNVDAAEQLARKVDMRILWKNKLFIQQMEAYLFGLSGLLPLEAEEVYPSLLKKEYRFLSEKWKLQSMKAVNWRFFRMRPSNFPTVRMAQLAQIYHKRGRWFPWVLTADMEELRAAIRIRPSAYWKNHYLFNRKSEDAHTSVGEKQFLKLMINVIVPIRFTHAWFYKEEAQKSKALELLSSLPAENNQIIRKWKKNKIEPASALQSQALIELFTNWCAHRKCLECSFGAYFLRDRQEVDRVEESFVTLVSRYS